TINQELSISDRGEEISAINKVNTLRVKQGDKITVKQAIEAVIVKSFNEAAVTLAEAVSGNEWEFVRKMNSKARDLGMNFTSFRNSTGCHEEGQYTNTYDLARLTIAIKKDFPQYYHFFALKEFSYNNKSYKTHNNILLEYKGAEGMKTGYTKASGYNLISLAKRNDEKLLSILVGCDTSKGRDKFAQDLFDKAFEESKKKYSTKVKLSNKFKYEEDEES
ncbi:MAG: D-alanyl-D-alanine carboxypeptidase, partial [Pelagibacterales bacterium]|nr:D-alanyl-D-alanine carboxypeptidase [Pelagibacterales bacterium]